MTLTKFLQWSRWRRNFLLLRSGWFWRIERFINSYFLRLELEVSAWLENVSFQLTEIGKELVEEVGMTVNQLLMQAREKGVNDEGFVQDLDIKFIPRTLKRSELGFFFHGNP